MDQTDHNPASSDLRDSVLDRKLQCLCSWLERTTQCERYAEYACLVLPMSTLAIGTALAIALLGQAPYFAIGTLTFALICAFVGFLVFRRNCQIWKDVARRVQNEQRILGDPARIRDWTLIGRVAPDRLADMFGRQTSIRFFAADAITFYGAALFIAVLFALLTLSRDDAGGTPEAVRSAATKPATEATVNRVLTKRPTF